MTKNVNQKGSQQKNEPSSEAYGSGSASGFLSESAKNPKDGSDWLGGPQNGDEIPSEADYTKHRFDATDGKSTEGTYQQNGQSWLGGPQNGSEIPGNGGNGGNGGNSAGDGERKSGTTRSTTHASTHETWTGRGKA